MLKSASIALAYTLAALMTAVVAQAKDVKFGDIEGWSVTGPGDGASDFKLTDYEGGADTRIKHGGKASAFLASKVDKPAKHGVVMQSVRSDRYCAKRIRVSAWVRTENVAEAAGLWVRVTPADRDQTLSRAATSLHGSADWQRSEVVLDVPAESLSILYGLYLRGRGKAWIDDMTWEVVDKSVPLAGGSEPLEPSNLDFEAHRP